MIDVALDFLQIQLNIYLHAKLDTIPSTTNAIFLLNVAQLQEGNSGNNNQTHEQNAYMTLVNVEEDRIGKAQENFVRKENGIVYKNPEKYLNLYVLFSVNLSSYEEALRRLSLIIQFFQQQNVFDPINSPSLDAKIVKLIVDMYSLNFEQLNHLWGILGGKYLPSVLYKVRRVTIDEDATISEAGFIREIQLNDKVKQPLS
jgi:hypothetical protein